MFVASGGEATIWLLLHDGMEEAVTLEADTPAIHPPAISPWLYCSLHVVRRMWPCATVIMHIERSKRIPTDPSHALAALV